MKILALLAVLFLVGCAWSQQTREEAHTEKVDRVTVTGAIPMAGPEGIIQVPVSFTIDRTGTEQAEKVGESKTGPDGAAIGREIASALGPVISSALASTGVPWAQILGGVGTTAVAGATGYLAIAKRDQMKAAPRG